MVCQMTASNFKGIILAAGFGTRLRPLTDYTPKPLMEFAGVPLFSLVFSRLQDSGLLEVATNTHHLSNEITSFLKDYKALSKVTVSYESSLLGTGGVYSALKGWRKKSPIISHNGDIVSDLNIGQLIKTYKSRNALAVMGLLSHPNPNGNSVWINKKNEIVAICEKKPQHTEELTGHFFSGIQALSPEFLDRLPQKGKSEIIPLYIDKIKENPHRFIGVVENAFWHDLGTPKGYFSAHKEFLTLLESNEESKDSFGYQKSLNLHNLSYKFFPQGVHSWNQTTVHGPSLIIESAQFEKNITIGPYTVVGDHVHIARGSHIRNSILLSHSKVRAHSDINHKIIHRKTTLDIPT